MIANPVQFDLQWLHTHGGARRRTKLEILGEALRAFGPRLRYDMAVADRAGARILLGFGA
jgi:hypothetical protein